MLILSQDRSFTDFIIELNTKNQLFDKGIDSTGRQLSDIGGEYSLVTMQLAAKKGKPKKSRTHINLNDTNEFYQSFKVYLDSQSDFKITADTIKDTTDLLSDWGKDILGLTEDSLTMLRLKAKLILIPYVKRVILGA